MYARPLFPGQHKHPGSQGWLEEIEQTRKVHGWKEVLFSRVGALLGEWGRDLKRIGYRINETQIQFKFPIGSMFSFKPLRVMFVQFNVWEPITKRPGTRVVRFGPNTASLMVLVRVLKSDGGDEWYLLARKKYQFAAQEHFVEFSRGYLPGKMDSDMGWALLDRDFPGFRVNGQLQESVENIRHTQLGRGVKENTAEYNNSAFSHLIVVTLSRHLSKDELKDLLVKASLEKEYGGNSDYPDPGKLDGSDLVCEPMVFELSEAARLLNAHLEEGGEVRSPFFGEQYSLDCWMKFLALFGWQFPDAAPKRSVLEV